MERPGRPKPTREAAPEHERSPRDPSLNVRESPAAANPATVDPLEAARAAALQAMAEPDAGIANSRRQQIQLTLAVIGALLVAAILAATFIQRRSDAKSPASPASAAAPAPAEAVQRAEASFSHAEIKGLEQVWVSVTTDGHPFLKQVLQKNEVREFQFSQDATLSVDDGQSLDFTLNSRTVPIPGGPRVLDLAPTGVQSVKTLQAHPED